ncbi:hypothetical protein T265_07178 [Opisthorchis viverrini]|uniref:Uncharacterized protein n=1 Tax=Opisthorchis viverrini TaxID=6198 RepID=A0A074ZDX8_OPIVI|nr:hypothetical protein T265_07178 [Opisthorchis viverrini]KER25378.1 hypothetical protein T265_07178 [Opisthorchis viverrini]
MYRQMAMIAVSRRLSDVAYIDEAHRIMQFERVFKHLVFGLPGSVCIFGKRTVWSYTEIVRPPLISFGHNARRFDEQLSMPISSGKLPGNRTEPAVESLECSAFCNDELGCRNHYPLSLLLLLFLFLTHAPLHKLLTSAVVVQTPRKTFIRSIWFVTGLGLYGPPAERRLSVTLYRPDSIWSISSPNPDPAATGMPIPSPIAASLTTNLNRNLSPKRACSFNCEQIFHMALTASRTSTF